VKNTEKETKIDQRFPRDIQYIKFCAYGFLKNLKFYDPFIILFFREMGLSFFQIGALYSIREISTNLLEIPTGFIADSFGRKRAMLLCFISYIISFLTIYFSPGYFFYAVAMVFFGVGEALRTGTHKAIILEYLKVRGILEHRVDYYSHTRSWAQLGSAVSSIGGALLVYLSGSLDIIFLATVFSYFLGFLLISTYPSYLNYDKQLEVKRPGSKKLIDTFKDFLQIFRSWKVFRIFLNSALFDGGFKTLKDYLQPVLKNYIAIIPILLFMEKEKRLGIIVGLVYFFLFILTSLSSRWSYRINNAFESELKPLNLLFLVGGFIILFSGIFYEADYFVLSILGLILMYLVQNMRRPLMVGYISGVIKSRVMASGLSAESQLKTIVVSIFSLIVGFIADIVGIGYGIGFVGLTVLVSFTFLGLRKL